MRDGVGAHEHGVDLVAQPVHPARAASPVTQRASPVGGGELAVERHRRLERHVGQAASRDELEEGPVERVALVARGRRSSDLDPAAPQPGDALAVHQRVRIRRADEDARGRPPRGSPWQHGGVRP